jgi:hypothetical protein
VQRNVIAGPKKELQDACPSAGLGLVAGTGVIKAPQGLKHLIGMRFLRTSAAAQAEPTVQKTHNVAASSTPTNTVFKEQRSHAPRRPNRKNAPACSCQFSPSSAVWGLPATLPLSSSWAAACGSDAGCPPASSDSAAASLPALVYVALEPSGPPGAAFPAGSPLPAV